MSFTELLYRIRRRTWANNDRDIQSIAAMGPNETAQGVWALLAVIRLEANKGSTSVDTFDLEALWSRANSRTRDKTSAHIVGHDA